MIAAFHWYFCHFVLWLLGLRVPKVHGSMIIYFLAAAAASLTSSEACDILRVFASRDGQKENPDKIVAIIPIGSMYAIYGNIYHPYTPNVSIYTIHGSYGITCSYFSDYYITIYSIFW